MYSTTVLVAVAVLAILIFRLLQTGKRPPGLPPGPPTIPILGNLHLFPTRDVHLQFKKWAEEYGPVYSVMLGTKAVVVLSSAEAVTDLMDKRSSIYSDRQDNYLGQTILSRGNRLIMMYYGPTWRLMRKMIHASLNQQNSTSFTPYQDLESKKLLFDLLNQPDRLRDSFRRFSMSVASSVTYGIRTVSYDDFRQTELFDVLANLLKIVESGTGNLLDVYPMLQSLPDFLLPMKKLARQRSERDEQLFMGLLNETKAEFKRGNKRPSLCMDMVIAQKEGLEELTDSIAAYTAGSVFEGGTDSTANTLYAWVQAMILYPEVQRKAQEAIDQVVGSDRMPETRDYAQLPYLRCCVKEIYRWFPTAVLGFPHATTEDDVYMGYRIPKGTGVINNVYTINMDPSRSPEPHRFNPDRFKDDDRSLADSIINTATRGTFAFGAGRRICQGMHVADISQYLGISCILWAFDILPAVDEKGRDILPDPSKTTQGFVILPEEFKAVLRPRSAARMEVIKKSWAAAKMDLDPETEQWK